MYTKSASLVCNLCSCTKPTLGLMFCHHLEIFYEFIQVSWLFHFTMTFSNYAANSDCTIPFTEI